MTRRKSMFAVCLLGLTWGGGAQAGFLGNNLELQFLQALLGNANVNVTVTNGIEVPNGPGGIAIDIGDTTVDITVPAGIGGDVGLDIVDTNNSVDPIIGAVPTGDGDVSHGPDVVSIRDLPAGEQHHVDVSFAVPEPGVIELFALGLVAAGLMVHRRR